MKKQILFLLAFSFALCFCAQSQPVVGGIMQGSPGTFMVNPATCNSNQSWARTYYGSSPNSNSALNDGNVSYTLGTTNYSSEPSHKLMIRTGGQSNNPQDPRACITGSTAHLPIYPLAWNSNEYPSNSGLHYEDTVMRIGAHTSSSKSQKMAHWDNSP